MGVFARSPDQPLRQPAVSSRLRVGREGAELRDLHTVGYKDSSPLHETISGPSRPVHRWPAQPTWDENILLTASTRAEDHGAAGYRLRGPTKPHPFWNTSGGLRVACDCQLQRKQFALRFGG